MIRIELNDDGVALLRLLTEKRLDKIRLMITDSEMQCNWPTDEGVCEDIDRCMFCSLIRDIDAADIAPILVDLVHQIQQAQNREIYEQQAVDTAMLS